MRSYISQSRLIFIAYSLLMIIVGAGLGMFAPILFFHLFSLSPHEESVTESISSLWQTNTCVVAPQPQKNSPSKEKTSSAPTSHPDIYALKQKLFESNTKIAMLKADIQNLDQQVETLNEMLEEQRKTNATSIASYTPPLTSPKAPKTNNKTVIPSKKNSPSK